MKFVKYLIFILFISCLLIEEIQGYHRLIEAPPLQGSFASTPRPTFKLSNWFSGKYQDSVLKNYESTLSIHNFFVRLHNQIDYSVFGKINVKEVEEGMGGYLFGEGYTKAYLGQDYIGDDNIEGRIKKLVYIQQSLKERGTELICIIAPGKSSYLAENLPGNYDLNRKTKSNYDTYSQSFITNSIHHVDMVNYFKELKFSVKHPLFTKGGIHWSGYGATLAADTLFRYMERIKGVDIVDFFDEGGEISSIPYNTDGDISNAMNLLYDIPFNNMYYPKIKYKSDTSKLKPNVLLIGDSFIMSWISFYDFIPNIFNSKSAFWYYAVELGWPADLRKPMKNVEQFDFKKEISNRDFIIIECNESKLYDFGFGFIDKLYNELQKDSLNYIN